MLVSLVNPSAENPLVFIYEEREDMYWSSSFIADEIIDYIETHDKMSMDTIILFESSETEMTHHYPMSILLDKLLQPADKQRVMRVL